MADDIEVIDSWQDPEPAAVEPAEPGAVVEESPTSEPVVEVAGEDAAAAPKRDRVQERIDELTRKRYEAEREKEYWKGKAEALSPGRSEEVETPKVADQSLPEPQEDQFDSYTDYTRALVQHEARKLLAAQEAAKEQERIHEQAQEKQRTYQEWVSKGKGKYADFSEIAESNAVPYTQAMADAIVGTDVGIDIAYYFGKNPGEAERISKLHPIMAAKEIGKLEVKLSGSQKSVSGAPTPIKPVSTGPAIPVDINAIEDDEAWLKAERERLAKQGRLY